MKFNFILSATVKEHVTQSRAVAMYLSELTGAEVLEAEVPRLTGAIKAKAKHASRSLVSGNRRDARDWLAMASADILVRKVGQWFAERNIYEGSREVLMISTGSEAAPYNLALGYIWRCACATIMTPVAVGTEPFDFAIVPEYEFPKRKTNILVTLGAPNLLTDEKLSLQAADFLTKYPASTDNIWSVIIGGDDSDYIITPTWVKKNIGQLMRIAGFDGASLYIAVIGNISKEAERTINTLISRASAVHEFFMLTNEAEENPIPAMLNFSDELFCTENLLDTITESITVGNKVVLMRMDWKKGIKNFLKRTISFLVSEGAMKPEMLLGTSRFEILFAHLIRHNHIVEFNDWIRERHAKSFDEEDAVLLEEFNEAKRAAEWIVSNWKLQ